MSLLAELLALLRYRSIEISLLRSWEPHRRVRLEAALRFMNGDPAVLAGVMTAALHPFSVAMERKNPE